MHPIFVVLIAVAIVLAFAGWKRKAVANILKVEELKTKILVTLGFVAIYRFGTQIVLPGIDPALLVQLREQTGTGLLSLLDMFSGGAFSNASIFALGIMPYISASIVIQLLTIAVPYFQKMQKEGESGRQKMNQITRYLTIAILLVQGPAYLLNLRAQAGIAINPITNGPAVNQYMQTSAPSVFACGNVVHVNDLVDNVSEESARAGKYAAQYAMGKLGGEQKIATCVTGRNVRYLCPQTVDAAQVDGKVSIYFRVLQPELDVKLVARCGDEVIASAKEFRVNPGEMCHLNVATEKLTGDVTVEVIKED